jgi:hypothetical protein
LVRSIEPGESWVWCYKDVVSPGEINGDALTEADPSQE